MSLGHGASIVRNGLVLHLDASNSKSYPGSGAIWNDLSGKGNNGTLTNSPTYNNSGFFAFDGTNDYVVCSANSAFNFGTGDVAIDCWIYWDGTYINTGRSIYGTGGSGSLDQFGIFQNVGIYFGGVNQNVPANYPPINQWSHIVASKIGTNIKIYVNGVETASGTQNLSIGSSSVPAYIGFRGADSAHPFKGNISSFKLYKGKGLLPTEVSQNFNAIKGRYGI